ncbi:replicative DNA helicase [Henriciella pelagia]|uniref:replicative DNA helicase n=1 Tax=Henriciella pelagia TaxID=1977912 RepID=UPI003511726C
MSLPENLSAEYGLVGGVLFSGASFVQVRDVVSAADFMDGACADCWQAFEKLAGAGKSITGVTVSEHVDLETRGQLAALMDHAVFGPELRDYAHIVADMGQRRALILAGNTLSSKAAQSSAADALNEHESVLDNIRERDRGGIEITSAAREALKALDNRDELAKLLVPTRFPTLDNEIGGLERGALSILAARPAMGKSAFAVCIAANMISAGETVGYFSLEMPSRDLGFRMGCYLGWRNDVSVPWFSDLKRNRATPAEYDRITQMLSQPVNDQFLADDRGGLNARQIAAQVRAWKAHCKRYGLPELRTIIVDHIGKASPVERSSGLYERTTYVSNELMNVAKDMDIAVLGLSQLTKEVGKQKRRPDISDLRDSGHVEQDAATIMLLHREDYYCERDANNVALDADERLTARNRLRQCKGQAEIIIGKCRNGPTGVVQMTHDIGKNVFRDLRWSRGEEEAA